MIQNVAAPFPAAFPAAEKLMQMVARWGQEALADLASPDTVWQLLAIVAASAAGYVLSRYPRKRLMAAAEARGRIDFVLLALVSVLRILWPAVTLVILLAVTAGFEAAALGTRSLQIAVSLLVAWIAVQVVTASMRRGLVSRMVAFSLWAMAALYIVGWLGPLAAALDSVILHFGMAKVTLLHLLTSLTLAAVTLWIGWLIGNLAQSQLRSAPNLPPSVGGLLGQTLKGVAIIIAFVVALNVIGVNLGALTFFSGALGVGIGFGLQSIFSNFISGVILLMEKTLKIGDFIELQGGLSGVVKEINFRSTVLTTNDNIDIIVPNEAFIKNQLINWTHMDSKRRIHVPFGVAYGTSKELVEKAGLEAAAALPWTFDDKGERRPQVWLVRFGEFRLDFELIVWLTDEAVLRPQKVMADYVWEMHSALERHGIKVPHPQRDIFLRAPEPISVRIDPGEGGA
ncbi:mechanosensitive ion channel domain-containing protein [Hyphomonas sp.]|uniref:mechanosensitive ion channel family protein n=1 Tax=Hyphomonas sp. TaxID=87 RepID=UPI0025B8D6FB|nr:mechanosensitive ion channel domain-containing protein [Hyphomonas sp.]